MKYNIADITENQKVFRGLDPLSLKSSDLDYIVKTLFQQSKFFIFEDSHPEWDYTWKTNIYLKRNNIVKKFKHLPKLERTSKHVLDSLRVNKHIELRHSYNKGPVYKYYKNCPDILDWISIPQPEQFTKPKYYYKTFFHEATHASCAKYRLNIRLNQDEEEIMSEFIGMSLCLMNGYNVWKNSISYMINWSYDWSGDKKRMTIKNTNRWDQIEEESKKVMRYLILRQ